MDNATTPVERARTILARCTSAEVYCQPLVAAAGERVGEGGAWQLRTLTVSPAHELDAADPAMEPVEVEVADAAPLPTRDRIRGRVRVVGTTRLGGPYDVLHVCANEVTLEEDGETVDVDLAALMVTGTDPLYEVEASMLGHLESTHADVLEMLARLVGARDLQGVVRVWPYRLDRHGLVLRLEHVTGHVDRRLHFRRTLCSPDELQAEMQALIGRAAGLRACGRPRETSRLGDVLSAAPAADQLCRPQGDEA